MSEDPYKRRLREHKRAIAKMLASQGYKVTPYENGVFHLEACRGQAVRKIRLCFTYPDKGDIVSVGHEPAPYRCQREIWYIGPTGRITLKAVIDGSIE